MSYTLDLAGDAAADLRDLEPWLQEEVLDEIDRLAADPSVLRPRLPGGTVIHDVTRDHAGSRHYLFITVHRDDARRRVGVHSVAHYSRAI